MGHFYASSGRSTNKKAGGNTPGMNSWQTTDHTWKEIRENV